MSVSTTAPLALWRIAEAFLHTFFALFGPPERIAAQHTLTHKPRALMLAWLRAGETLMRRLLLIEASTLVAPNATPRVRVPRRRERKLMGFTAEHPEQWRVSFRCMDRRRLAGMRRSRPARTPAVHTRFYSAWPLAERAEAMLRVFNNPAPFAKRLAPRLHREPKRALELLKHTESDRNLVGGARFDQVRDAAYIALKHDNSS